MTQIRVRIRLPFFTSLSSITAAHLYLSNSQLLTPSLNHHNAIDDLFSSYRPTNLELTSDMNEHLIERFGRGKAGRGKASRDDSHMPHGLTARPPATLNLSIREYAQAAEQPADLSHWTAFREIPSSNEVFDRGRTEHDTALELAENTIVGPYISKEEYLETHYRLLREDAVAVCITSNQCSLDVDPLL